VVTVECGVCFNDVEFADNEELLLSPNRVFKSLRAIREDWSCHYPEDLVIECLRYIEVAARQRQWRDLVIRELNSDPYSTLKTLAKDLK